MPLSAQRRQEIILRCPGAGRPTRPDGEMANKKNISVRLGIGDLRRIKEIALCLDVKESDVFRFAVKLMSTRLMPLLNRQLKGIPMLMALLESGEELLRYFEFDAYHLDQLINGD